MWIHIWIWIPGRGRFGAALPRARLPTAGQAGSLQGKPPACMLQAGIRQPLPTAPRERLRMDGSRGPWHEVPFTLQLLCTQS